MDNKNCCSPKSGEDKLVTVTTAGGYVTTTELARRNTKPSGKKIDKNHYCDSEGNVYEYKHTENRSQSPKSVRRSLNKLVDIINTNTEDLSRCRWVTLTYAENMTDDKQLMKDWENFRKKGQREWGKFEYIVVKEPQARGAWHLHVIMIFDDKAPYIDNTELKKKWGKGFVSIKQLKNGANLGLYFTASLRDIPSDEAEKAGINLDNRKMSSNKKYVKGARLDLYPCGVRIYTCSKGINRPIIETMTKNEAKSRVKNMKKVTETKIDIINGGRRVNRMTKTTYKDKQIK